MTRKTNIRIILKRNHSGLGGHGHCGIVPAIKSIKIS